LEAIFTPTPVEKKDQAGKRGFISIRYILSSLGLTIHSSSKGPLQPNSSTGVGVNIASNIVRKVFGLPLREVQDYEAGKLYIRFTDDLITDMDKFQRLLVRGED
jgi:hypothetical protein